MTNKTGFRKKPLNMLIYDWLLISACVMIFVVLPLLLAWNSMNLIHNRVYKSSFRLQKTTFIESKVPNTPVPHQKG